MFGLMSLTSNPLPRPEPVRYLLFSAQGQLANGRLAARLDQTIAGFMDLAEAAKHYPCANTAWVEFLGEHPDSPGDRVDTPSRA